MKYVYSHIITQLFIFILKKNATNTFLMAYCFSYLLWFYFVCVKNSDHTRTLFYYFYSYNIILSRTWSTTLHTNRLEINEQYISSYFYIICDSYITLHLMNHEVFPIHTFPIWSILKINMFQKSLEITNELWIFDNFIQFYYTILS